MNVLVVDDSALIRKAVIRILMKSGYDLDEVYEAMDGEEALEILSNQEINLLLTDLYMPGMSGQDMIREMQKHKQMRRIPIVVISTESDISRIKELYQYGIKGFIHKPFTTNGLIESIYDPLEALLKETH